MPKDRDSGRGRVDQRQSSRARSRSSSSQSQSQSRSSSPHQRRPKENRRRKESPEDENTPCPPKKKSKNSSSAGQIKKPTKEDRDEHAVDKGRMYGRWIDMWGMVRPVLEEGMAHDYDIDDQNYTKDQNRRAKIFLSLVDFMPRIEEMLVEPGATKWIASDLEHGRSAARSTDVSSMKNAIHNWMTFTPPYSKTQKPWMGFKHETCGRLLCPPGLDWSNPDIKQGLDRETIKLQPDDFPRFLYLNEEHSEDDVFEGFLKGDLLVKGYTHLMKAPSLAASGGVEDRGSRKGNAALHGISKTNIRSIAYAAVLICFVLGSQSTLTIGGPPGRWPYGQFYRAIVEVCEMMPSAQRGELLTWWDERIFGDIAPGEKEECNVLGSKHITMAERMKAQLAAAAAAESDALANITNAS
ncbi:hypothetical protein HWV62_19323 [Athelia sp. TMB]|nr:hypothetical protein HWV62_19323 [Athelia sp. TMB]